jgi:hypothetical protein
MKMPNKVKTSAAPQPAASKQVQAATQVKFPQPGKETMRKAKNLIAKPSGY